MNRVYKLRLKPAIQDHKDKLFWHSDIIEGGIRFAQVTGRSKREAEANAQSIIHALELKYGQVEEGMNQEQLRLLNALHDLIAVNPNLVTDEQYNVYNELLDLAEENNILW